MTLIWRIARKEWTEWRRDGRVVVLLGCLTTLLVAAVIGGVLAASRAAELKSSLAAADRENFVQLRGLHQHSASHRGRLVYTPAPPLTYLDRGLLDSLGVAARAIAHRFDGFEYPPDADRTGLAHLGNVSAAGVLQVLAPLVLILLLFGSFAAEREAGTLQQLVAAGIPAARLLAGKALAALAVIMVLLLVTAVAGMVAIGTAPGFSKTTQAARLGILLTAYGIYLVVWIGLALAVSAWVRRSHAALAVLLCSWILTVGILPKLVVAAATSRYALPTLEQVRQAGSYAAAVRANPELGSTARRDRLLAEALASFKVSRVQDLPFYFEGIVLDAREQIDASLIAKSWSPVWDVYDRQARVIALSAAVSPLLAIQPLSMSMTETDVWHLRRFFAAFLDYRHTFVNALNRDMTLHARIQGTPCSERLTGCAHVGEEWATYDPGRDTWERMPDFAYAPARAIEALRSQTVSLMALAAWAVVAWALALAAASRMEVRS